MNTIEARAFTRHLVREGYQVTISDTEGYLLKNGTRAEDIESALESVEECVVTIKNKAGERIAKVFLLSDSDGLECIDSAAYPSPVGQSLERMINAKRSWVLQAETTNKEDQTMYKIEISSQNPKIYDALGISMDWGQLGHFGVVRTEDRNEAADLVARAMELGLKFRIEGRETVRVWEFTPGLTSGGRYVRP